MGYTHYYPQNRDFTMAEWKAVKEGARKAIVFCQRQGIGLARDWDGGSPSVSQTGITLNGALEDGDHAVWDDEQGHVPTMRYGQCETFHLPRRKELRVWMGGSCGQVFHFCKTGHLPYDLAVCLILLVAHSVAPGAIEVGSDGNWETDWAEARAAYKEIFGQEPVPFGIPAG